MAVLEKANLKEIKSEVVKAVKYFEYMEDCHVEINVYEDQDVDKTVTYLISIDCYEEGSLKEIFNLDIFEGEKEALKRAKAIHKSVSGWLAHMADVKKEIRVIRP